VAFQEAVDAEQNIAYHRFRSIIDTPFFS